jgi:hypothetical protein
MRQFRLTDMVPTALTLAVTPAKAGVPLLSVPALTEKGSGIPAFAGMTERGNAPLVQFGKNA